MGTTAEKTSEKLDIHQRNKTEQESDEWFKSEFDRTSGTEPLKPLDSKRYGYAVKGAFITITRQRGAESRDENIHLIPAIYDLTLLQKRTTELALAKKPTEQIAQTLHEECKLSYGVVLQSEGEGTLGNRRTVPVAPVPDGIVSAPLIEAPIVGTPIIFTKDGYEFGSFTSKEEYLRWLPALRAGWHFHNQWCVDLPTESVAYLADQAEETLKNLNNQLRNLHGVSIYSISPRHLRYYSDGDMKSQRSGEYGLRSAYFPSGGMRPLLYDAPAWVVGLRIGSRMVPGRVFVTPEGRFIGSDWCQREADKNGGIDLHTGQYTRHTLMSWCAGPGISKFGDDEIKKRHGSVRRASLPASSFAGIGSAKVAARKKLLKLLVTVKNTSTLRDGMFVDDETTQESSLRYFVKKRFLDDEDISESDYGPFCTDDGTLTIVGFAARFGKYSHIAHVPTQPGVGLIAPQLQGYDRYPGVLSDHWAIEESDDYVITDKALVKEIVTTMKEAF